MLKDSIKSALKSNLGIILSVKDLAVICDHRLGHESGPGIRDAIRTLINEGCPIGARSTGYYWITTKTQLEEYTGSLQARCDAISKRIGAVVKAYKGERNSRHLNSDLSLRSRCMAYVVYLAEESGIPYQAVWALAYRKLTKLTGVDTCTLPSWYRGSILNYLINRGLGAALYECLDELEETLL